MLRQAAALASCLFGCACASMPPSPYSVDATALAAHPDVTDSRGRFREIFCAILDERAESVPDARPCDEALTRYGRELDGTGAPVALDESTRHLMAVIVEGVGWNCFSNWLKATGSSAEHVRQFGYEEVVVIEVESLSSCEANARQIRDAIMAMEHDGDEPHIVLIGYSKGAPDILEAVVAYPEIRRRIAAVVSAAGAIGGSPLADEVTQSTLKLFRHWPGAQCSEGDGGAVESLRPAVRKAWLADNPLPQDVPYYSLVTCPEPERISKALKSTYKKLSKVDARNDGMMAFDDQLVPGSTFIACVNADHWAVSVPIARTHPTVGSLFVDENDYPREALLETILRFVEEDLATPAD
jgi:pimeloyl-ACP methyl ester carboxylesterase